VEEPVRGAYVGGCGTPSPAPRQEEERTGNTVEREISRDVSEALKYTILNLGAGRKRRSDAFNVDLVAGTHPELVWDLNRLPWPLPSGHFREVLAYDVIEHLEDLVAVMEEIHRVCAAGAVVRITLPHYSCANAFTDPTHRHYFSLFTFHYFTGENQWEFYTGRRFRRMASRLYFYPTLFNKLVWRLANRYPEIYERRWAWIFPAWFLSFELEVIK
jgi:SAM-dependent methyltransferase